MDNEQVFALRHKRHIVAKNLQLDENAIADLMSRKLITKSMLDNMKEEIANFVLVVKYLELLEDNPKGISRGSFNRLCDFLDSISGFWWITDELRAELKTVRGDLVIEGYVRDEARRIVEVEFGPIKRLSDSEKLEIENIAAVRMQHYKEVFKRAIEAAVKALEELNRINAEKDAQQERLLKQLRQYIRVHENLYDKTDEVKGRTVEQTKLSADAADDVSDEKEQMMAEIRRFVRSLRTVSENSLTVRRDIRGEKLRTLRVIGVDDMNAKLEPEVTRTLTPIDGELDELNAVLSKLQRENDERQARLTAIVDDRRIRVAIADENIRSLNERLEAESRHGIELRDTMHQLQLKIVQTRTRIEKYSYKAGVMDHTRNKGYVVGSKTVAIVRVSDTDRQAQRRGSMFDLSLSNNVVDNGLPILSPPKKPSASPVAANNKR